MDAPQGPAAAPRRLIVSYADAQAYVSMARVILAKMGYAILAEEEWRAAPAWATREPELRIVDERRLADVPEDPPSRRIPMILLTGRQGADHADPRILGAVRRPAGLHELYRLIQQALETTPRATPRIPTHLPARCRRGAREWRGAVLSLSESGCLLRSSEPVDLGTELEIAFELPRVGWVETRAESAYQLLPDTGLVFQGAPASLRSAIARFVEQSLGTT
jgi:hypothetical protein